MKNFWIYTALILSITSCQTVLENVPIPEIPQKAVVFGNIAVDGPQNIPDEHGTVELFETNTSVDPAHQDSPVKETADFFTLLRNWLKPRTV